jgi:hypothetical protein
MTNRLPTPGGDSGDWGDILNAFLEVSLTTDGTLNSNVVGTSQIQVGSVTNAQLDDPTQTAIAAIADKYVKPVGGIPATDLASSVQANLASASTAVQIGGDLSGINISPIISKIQGVTVSTPAGGSSSFLNASGTWTTPTGGGGGGLVLDTTATDIQSDTTTGTAVAGNTGKAADAGHQHPLISHDHSTANKGGQLNPTTSLTTNGTASSSTYLRGDNTWATPTAGVVIDSTASDIQMDGTQSAGSIGKAADAGHVHPTDTSRAPLASPIFTGTLTAPALKLTTGTGIAGQVLTSDSSGNATWQTVSGSGVQALTPTTVKASAYTASPGDFIPVDVSGGSVTISLPSSPADGTHIGVKLVNIGSTSNSVTITSADADVFNIADGSTSIILSLKDQGAILQYSSSSKIWYVQEDDIPLSQLESLFISGNVTRAGTGSPSPSIGNLGDNYLDVTNNLVYGPKAQINSYTPFPATSIVESWQNVGAPDSNWTTPWYGGSATILTSGQLTSVNSAAVGGAEFTGEGQFTAQEIWTTVGELGISSDYIDLFLCCGTISGFYRIKFSPGGQYANVYNYSGTSLGLNGSINIASGDMIGANCYNGVVNVYHCLASQLVNGVPPQGLTPILSVNDSTYTGGYTAIALSSQNIAIGPVATGQVNDSTSQPSWGSGQGLPIGKYITVPAPTGVAATDTANLATAMSVAAAATSGGTGAKVILGAGTYVTSATVTLPGYTVLEGLGHSISVIQAAPGLNAPVVQTAGFSTYTGGSQNGPQGFQLKALTIDGNKANQTSRTPCFQSYGYNWLIDDVYMINGYQTGMYSEWGGSDNPMESWIRNSKIYNYGGTAGSVGLDWNGPHDTQIEFTIIATLDSTIKYQDVTYGSTPINGTSAVFPTVGISFTFACTGAVPNAVVYPTGGGSFLVPLVMTGGQAASASPTIQAPYATVTYTGYSTSNGLTTFTGCTANVGATATAYTGTNSGIVVPSYGFRTNMGSGTHGADGEMLTNVHIWGRNHLGFYTLDQNYLANCYLEGAILVNATLGVGCTWVGGFSLGTSGNSGHQPTEIGLAIGTVAAHARTVVVQGVMFQAFSNTTGGYSGFPICFTNDAAANIINAVVDASSQYPYCGQPTSIGNFYAVLMYGGYSPNNLVQLPEAAAPGAGYQVFTQQNAAITNVVISGTTVTITTTTALLNLINGNTVLLGSSGITGSVATTSYTVSSVSTSGGQTTFTVTVTGSPAWTSGGNVLQNGFTYRVPSKSTTIQALCVGGGGGGQSGGVQASGTVAVGGSGGGGGGVSSNVTAANPGGTIPVTIGYGGGGGLAISTNSTAGASGTAGGVSSAGSVAYATGGGAGAQLTAGSAGLGLTQSGGTSAIAISTGVAGSAASNSGTTGGGGAGGGITTANAIAGGTKGGGGNAGTVAGGSGGNAAVGANGYNSGGNQSTTTGTAPGGGGGGGGAAIAGGYAGGNAGNYGAGGGGGGAAQNGATSGAGGNGASGIVVVSTW